MKSIPHASLAAFVQGLNDRNMRAPFDAGIHLSINEVRSLVCLSQDCTDYVVAMHQSLQRVREHLHKIEVQIDSSIGGES